MKSGTRGAALLLAVGLLVSLLPVSALALGDLSGGTITLTREVYEYNGYANEPDVIVTVDGETLQRDEDFTVDYSDNVKPGTALVVVSGRGDWSGSMEKHFIIRPRTLTNRDLTFDQVPVKAYDGTCPVTFRASVDTVAEDLVTAVCTGTFADPYAGTGKTVTAESAALSGADSGNYVLDFSGPVTLSNGQITPKEPEIRTEAELKTGGNTLDLNSLAEDRAPGQTLRFSTDLQTKGSVLSSSGVLTSGEEPETLRIPVTMEAADLNGDGNPEYTLSRRTITVAVVEKQTQTPVTIITEPSDPGPSVGGNTGADQAALVYSGSTEVNYGETLALSVAGGSGSGEVSYTLRPITGDAVIDRNGILTPKKAGVVWVTAQKKGDDAYKDGIPVSAEVTIHPAKIVIRVRDKTAQAGDPVPTLTDEDYTITGLKAGEYLKRMPVLRYASQPNMSRSGSVAIVAEGAEVLPNGNYDPDIAYFPGTFTVTGASGGRSASSSGGTSSAVQIPASRKTHVILLWQMPHGTVATDRHSAAEGETVAVTVRPEEGFVCRRVLVTGENGRELSVTGRGEGQFTFLMPAGGVAVSAEFAPSSGVEPPPVQETMPFTDVKPGDWYCDSVFWAWKNGVMQGTSETLFSPDLTTSRGMIVTVLYRLAGSPQAPARSPFADVSADAWYAGPVSWAAWYGIVTGYDGKTFGPDDPITREQMAAVFYRYAAFRGLDVSASASLTGFSDAGKVHDYADTPLSWAVAMGLIRGMGDGTLAPQGRATRAQAAAILQRFDGQYPRDLEQNPAQ